LRSAQHYSKQKTRPTEPDIPASSQHIPAAVDALMQLNDIVQAVNRPLYFCVVLKSVTVIIRWNQEDKILFGKTKIGRDCWEASRGCNIKLNLKGVGRDYFGSGWVHRRKHLWAL
jgi:hypothetical protein